jgi:hypothetical protein
MTSKTHGTTVLAGLGITLVTAAILGWIANIVKLVGMPWGEPLGIEAVLRIIGVVFAPLGTVMGLFV